MSRLEDLRVVDQVLSKIADDYSNEQLVYNKLFPTVKVGQLAGKIPVFGKDAFISRTTLRAIRAKSNRIPPSDFTMSEYELKEYDIEIALDENEISEANQALRLETRVVKELTDVLELGKEKTVADYVQTIANYAVGSYLDVQAGSQWNDYTITTVDPISDIQDGKEKIHDLIVRMPNTMIIGQPAYRSLINHPKIVEKVAYAGLSVVSLDILKQILDIPNIYIGLSKYSTNGTTLTNLWNDNVVLAYVDQSDRNNASEFNPSYAYTLQKEGMPQVDTYTENGGKIKVIRNTDKYTTKVVNASCAYLIYNVNH